MRRGRDTGMWPGVITGAHSERNVIIIQKCHVKENDNAFDKKETGMKNLL
jgi:hypothetical protein